MIKVGQIKPVLGPEAAALLKQHDGTTVALERRHRLENSAEVD
jgi:hypothetical protein